MTDFALIAGVAPIMIPVLFYAILMWGQYQPHLPKASDGR